MSTQLDSQGTVSTGSGAATALDELLRGSPSALVAALGPDGMQDFPDSVRLHGQSIFDGGLGIDIVAAEDQVIVLDGWIRSGREPVVSLEIHLLADPDQLATVHFFDVRAEHGVHVVVLEAADPDLVQRSVGARAAQRRPTARVSRDAMAVFTEVDEATTALLGWRADELIGQRTLDLVHPDDTERAIDAWMAMRNGVDTGRVRARYRHADGHYVWIEITNENQLQDPAIGCVLSELVDISGEMAHLEELRERERNLARLAEALPIGICHVRADGEVVYSNAPLTALLGPVDSHDALVNSVAWPDRAKVGLVLTRALQGHGCELEVEVPHGLDERRCELTFRPMSSDKGGVDGVIVCASDVTDRSRLRAELEHRATHDALSGCLNRGATVAALERALQTSPQVAVAYLDLNGFKAINDEFGHAAGDELLRVAAARLRATIRSDDLVGRIGGDEFVVICPQGHGAFVEADLLRRLAQAIDGEVTFAHQRIPLSASLGVAVSLPAELDGEAVLSRADAAMYEAKRCHRRPRRLGVAALRIATS
jgi:diguanylate cyclase (GGDEF)-like protein/PAS domain S-box-containing protein